MRRIAVLVLAWLPWACRTGAPSESVPADSVPKDHAESVAAVRETLHDLYRAFDFDPGAEADWEGMRKLFLDGAVFVAPVRADRPPRGVDGEQFIADFREWIATSDVGRTGLHERVTHARIDVFGHLAHAYVVFEGYVPGAQESDVQTRGLDSIQFVQVGGRWRVASFTTQYAEAGEVVPERFRPESARFPAD